MEYYFLPESTNTHDHKKPFNKDDLVEVENELACSQFYGTKCESSEETNLYTEYFSMITHLLGVQ